MDQGSEKTVGYWRGTSPCGLPDILCVLVAGHRALANPPPRMTGFIRKVAEVLRQIDPVLGSRIAFTDEPLKGMDAVIATGAITVPATSNTISGDTSYHRKTGTVLPCLREETERKLATRR
jgi:hypothetical protein